MDHATSPITARRIGSYLACIAATWLLVSYAYLWTENEIAPSFPETSGLRGQPDLIAKLDYYETHSRAFDLVFFGDSRTYCDIPPSRIDLLLGTRSFNLATRAHWFPTQFPHLQDLLPRLAPGTTVVWSIGHQNFRRATAALRRVYPIGLRNVPRYLRWGFSWSGLLPNVIDGLPGGALLARRAQLRGSVDDFLARPIARWPADLLPEVGAGQPASALLAPAVRAEMAAWQTHPETILVRTVQDGAQITSLEVYERAGNYVRVELQPQYFRERQRHVSTDADRLVDGRFSADPEYWQNFLAIVELFERSGVHLIVNEVEEAPYFYASEPGSEAYRAFMRELRAFFEQRGIPYVRADWESFTDSDYFDHNHLNSTGIEKYVPQLATLLRPHLR